MRRKGLLVAASLLALSVMPDIALAQAITGPGQAPPPPADNALQSPAAAAPENNEVPKSDEDPGVSGGIEDIVVTAQKRGVAERAQDVPVAITALNSAALQSRNVVDLSSLTTAIPNVSLESSGTFNGQANFEIRGFGISSSIPSVEPSVGVFVDGVYQGQTAGVLTTMFDVESLEVLRGPQGTLFGRNTTGGAVSITTRRPGDKFALKGRFSVESGLNLTAAASVEGPITDTLRAKLTGYSAYDEGYFHNRFTGSKYGKTSTQLVRPTMVWDVTPDLDTTLIFEYGHVEGDGAAGVNSQIQDGFNLNIDYDGVTDITWKHLTSETNLQVGFGNGVITNVAGWQWLDATQGLDVDGLPIRYFNLTSNLDQHQFSEELRYAGTFGPVKLTVGAYYFTQRYSYIENRDLISVPYPVGFGGRIDQDSAAAFGQLELALSERFSLIAGGRYSWEKKQAEVATLSTTNPRCNFATLTCDYNFPGAPFADDGSNTWSRFSPKLGFQWRTNDDMQIYGSYSEGIRSGGYNVRSSVGGVSPGPYDQEIQDAFELGAKTDLFDRRVRFNVAAFYNKIRNLQRDVQTADPVVGSAQVTANVGTSEIYGGEAELTVAPVTGLTLGLHGGYLHGRYTKLTADLNGTQPGFGYELQLVRLPSWSYGGEIAYRIETAAGGRVIASTDYGHVDRSAAQDNNQSFLRARDNWNANLSYSLPGGGVTLSLYARNLLDRVQWAQASPRSAGQGGGVFLTLNKGRVLGGAVSFDF